MIQIGDFVTSCEAGFWQLIDIKPKIADSDYIGERISWKKGEQIGHWVILKKAFTPKLKPNIDFSYVDSSWLRPVSPETLTQIHDFFAKNPEYKDKFDRAEVKLRPMITNCWFDLPEDMEATFQATLKKLPPQYTMEEFWKIAQKYKCYVSNPPTRYLINFMTYPWALDKKANLLYSAYELRKTC